MDIILVMDRLDIEQRQQLLYMHRVSRKNCGLFFQTESPLSGALGSFTEEVCTYSQLLLALWQRITAKWSIMGGRWHNIEVFQDKKKTIFLDSRACKGCSKNIARLSLYLHRFKSFYL